MNPIKNFFPHSPTLFILFFSPSELFPRLFQDSPQFPKTEVLAPLAGPDYDSISPREPARIQPQQFPDPSLRPVPSDRTLNLAADHYRPDPAGTGPEYKSEGNHPETIPSCNYIPDLPAFALPGWGGDDTPSPAK